MERTASASLISSLAAYGEEEVSDEEKTDGFSAVDNISDEEVDASGAGSRASSRPILDEAEDNTSSSGFQEKPAKRKPTRLVSYAKDAEDSDEEEEEEEESEEETESERKNLNTSLNPEQASSLSRSVRNKSVEEIELPPEPAGKCSKHLQDKITRLYEKMKREGLNMMTSIERRKDFRNPSIYEKLIEYCGIDEKGTNYPPDVFDPHKWGKESFYDSLDKLQKVEMEKWEKERKERTKIEFVTGTKKSSSSSADGPDEKKRKSKWDSQPPGPPAVSGMINPSVVHLTSSVTGTKSTVIPALGSINKKPPK